MRIRRLLARSLAVLALVVGSVGLLGGVAHAEKHTDCSREMAQAKRAHETSAAMNRYELNLVDAGIPISMGLDEMVKEANYGAGMADLLVSLCRG
jgi:hypothetical protein